MRLLLPALAALLLSLLLASCRCPPDKEMGQLSLTPAALDFLPYDGSEVLRFTSVITGETITFRAPRGEERGTDQVCVRIICSEARYNSPSSCEYFLADNLRYIFVSDDQQRLIDLSIYTNLYQQDTENFFDAVQLSYSSGTPSIQASSLIEQRFSGPFEAEERFSNLMLLRPTLEINGDIYTDVLSFRQNNLGFYLQAGKGVIALEENTQFWVLEE